MSMNENGMAEGGEQMRSLIPQRKDVMQMFLSGVVGSDPRETYLSNGHFVINFSMAVTGHFEAVHDWEKYKPAETMWLNCEVWDEEAKHQQQYLRKGVPVSALAYMIFNKWTDKTTGEEKKQYKIRITNILDPSDMQIMLASSGIQDLVPQDDASEPSDSGFADHSPDMYDQFEQPSPARSMPPRGNPPQQQQQRASPPRTTPMASPSMNYNAPPGANTRARAAPAAENRGELDGGYSDEDSVLPF